MTIWLTRLFLLLPLSTLTHASSITVTPNLDPIFQEAQAADDRTLFIFDVDDVLVIPSDQILLASHQKDAKVYAEQYRKNYSEKQCYHLWSIARKALNPRLIDPTMLDLFTLLHQKHIKTIALTNAGTGKLGTIPYIEDLRIQELHRLGLDFHAAFTIKKFIKFYSLQSQADQKRLPMYKQGILFTCNVAKGKVLEAFLKRIKWKPTKIVFTDDKMKHVESVRDFCQGAHIPFQGFHYTGVEQLDKSLLNKERAGLQFKTLADSGRWLSDAEADQFLQPHEPIKIHRISQVFQTLSNIPQDTLVLWDVDFVILTPKDLFGRPKARALRRDLFKEYEKKYGIEKVKHLHSLFMLKGSGELVEPEILTLIQNLQRRGISTMALTAIETDQFGIIKFPVEHRINSLKALGITFSNYGAIKNMDTGKWVLKEGILFTNRANKGKVLESFIKLLSKPPSKVIFIDDDLKQVEDVLQHCQKLRVDCIGIHYDAEVFKSDPDLNPKTAQYQLEILDQKGIWLSDAEADKLLAQQV